MCKSNDSLVPNKVSIGWHFSSNKYAHRDVYSALKRTYTHTGDKLFKCYTCGSQFAQSGGLKIRILVRNPSSVIPVGFSLIRVDI